MNKPIFIPGNVPSSKNSKVWTGRVLMSSKKTKKYINDTEDYFISEKDKFLEKLEGKQKPYLIKFHFVRDSRRRYDFINPLQTIQDLLVVYKWIEDDNVDEMIPLPLEIDGKLSSHNPKNPGVYIDV